MAIEVRLTSLRISDGTTLEPPNTGVVLLVGPNNAGKSQALRDIVTKARDRDAIGRVIMDVAVHKHLEGDFGDWVKGHLPGIERLGVVHYQVPGWGEVPFQYVTAQWHQDPLGNIAGIFVLHLSGESRLTAGNSQQNIDLAQSTPNHPVHHAYASPDLEAKLDQAGRAAFGLGVTVDRYAGSVVTLRVGEPPVFEHLSGRPTPAYLQAMRELTRLEDQGDGVRSYIGLLLNILAGVQQVLLVDEPEAFLHPPQARHLGQVLAMEAVDKQIFVATHSSDIVRGALEGSSPVTIVRITRDGQTNHAAVLPDVAVKELWADPLLRYSNVLDGLFHDAVVLCEGDADCRFYSAVLEHLPRASAVDAGHPAERDAQLLFTHCGGKDRIPSVVRSLRAVSVPVVVVADFDVLRDETLLRKIVVELVGDSELFRADRQLLANALTSDTKPLRKATLKDELVARIDALPNEVLTPREAETVRAIVKADDGWDKAKRSGTVAVPQGDPYEACERLLANARAIGLLIVPVGEVERFSPGTPGHGPQWVTAALERKVHENPGQPARDFVAAILAAAQVQR